MKTNSVSLLNLSLTLGCALILLEKPLIAEPGRNRCEDCVRPHRPTAAENKAAQDQAAAEAAERARIEAAAVAKLNSLKQQAVESEAQLNRNIDTEISRLKEEWTKKVDQLKTDTLSEGLIELIREEVKETVKEELNKRLPPPGPLSQMESLWKSINPGDVLGRLDNAIVRDISARAVACQISRVPSDPANYEKFFLQTEADLAAAKNYSVTKSLTQKSAAFEIDWIQRSSAIMKVLADDPKVRDTIASMKSFIEDSVAAAASSNS